jgi:type II secretory pathway component GspD/PulD (secretin)
MAHAQPLLPAFAALLLVAAAPAAGMPHTPFATLLGERTPRVAAMRDDQMSRAAAKPSRLITLEKGRLTVIVHDEPLRGVLEEVAQKSGLKIVVAPAIDERVSANVQALPLDEGVRRLLKSQNIVLLYAQASGDLSSRVVLAGVSVWPRASGSRRGDDGEDLQRFAAEGAADVAGLPVGESWKQVSAASGGDEAIEPVLASLKAGDLDARRTAVEELQRLQRSSDPGVFPSTDVIQIAVQDDDAQVRTMALEILQRIAEEWKDPHAVKGLEQALLDPDPDVHTRARQLLDDLHRHLMGSAAS